MDRYSVEYFSQNHIHKDQLNILLDSNRFKQVIQGKTFAQIYKFLQVDRTTIEKYSIKYQCHDIINWTSSYLEDQIEDICKNNSIEYVRNTSKIIPPLELDFYFPHANAAIECHRLYWHSENITNKVKEYHWNKWKMCEERGIDLYQYFEDEINDKFEVIKSKILYLNNKHLGKIIGARELSINWLKNRSDEEHFYNSNHLQGIRYDRTHVIGACNNQFDLVAVMSIKCIKSNQMEIVRFATDIVNRYPGAFSKMLTWAINQLNFKGEVLSWSDNRHSNGHLYKSNGFKYVREQGLAYFVTDYVNRWRREHFMKNKIKERHPEVDLNKTEW